MSTNRPDYTSAQFRVDQAARMIKSALELSEKSFNKYARMLDQEIEFREFQNRTELHQFVSDVVLLSEQGRHDAALDQVVRFFDDLICDEFFASCDAAAEAFVPHADKLHPTVSVGILTVTIPATRVIPMPSRLELWNAVKSRVLDDSPQDYTHLAAILSGWM